MLVFAAKQQLVARLGAEKMTLYVNEAQLLYCIGCVINLQIGQKIFLIYLLNDLQLEKRKKNRKFPFICKSFSV